MSNTIYITTDADGYADGASRIAGTYRVPLTATGQTWALGIERVYVAYGRDSKTIIWAFGTRADMDAYVAETGNADTGRTTVDRTTARLTVSIAEDGIWATDAHLVRGKWQDGATLIPDEDGCPSDADDALYGQIADAIATGDTDGRIEISGHVYTWRIS